MAAYEARSHKGDHAPIIVRIFAPPMVACDPAKTWKAAAKMIERRLRVRYGEAIQTEFIELFSSESFSYPEIMPLVETNAASPPYVTINGLLVLSRCSRHHDKSGNQVHHAPDVGSHLAPSRDGRNV